MLAPVKNAGVRGYAIFDAVLPRADRIEVTIYLFDRLPSRRDIIAVGTPAPWCVFATRGAQHLRRATSMRRFFAAFSNWLGLLAAVSVMVGVPSLAWASHDPDGTYCAEPAEAAMLSLINDFRAGRGLDPLELSEPLGAAATHKSEEMAREAYLSHVSPDDVTPRELLAAHGYAHNTATGENIAAGQESAQTTFAQWRDSPSHRELMLDEEFEAIGIARAYNVETDYDWYWTAEFGGVLAEPAETCATPDESSDDVPAATPAPSGDGATPVRLICDGLRLEDGTYDLSCREE